MAQQLTWFPVLHPEDGFWEVAVRAVRLGNVTLDDCSAPRGCRGIVDTGASRSMATPLVGGGCRGEDLHFDLGEMTLSLRVEDLLPGATLRQYYTALDWAERRIGFAPAATRRVAFGRTAAFYA
eukprot:Skav212516  [mRNA]  locus=scaffold2713:307735:314539:+ [translate_table: standard]